MTEALVGSVKSNLRSQFYHVNDSWLKECVEYYTSEQNDLSLSAVQAFVTSQWLLSDLREINNEQGYLPVDFSQQAKTVLPGRYILQVDKMCDISQSKYSQLQKIRNVSETNVKATAIETPAWEPKGKRVIQLWLTDGIQELTAIEYKPIKKLKDTLLPGFKVMIIGPVTCRRGVIMLEEENYKEIGGEVDSLLKPNALENVLARALGMEENETPYAEDKQADNAAQIDDGFPEDEFDLDFEELTHIERLSTENREVPVAPAPRSDNVPERTALASKKTVKPSGNSARNTMTNYFNRENGSDTQTNSQKENFFTGDDCFDGVDFDELEENTLRKYNGTKAPSKPAAVEIGNKFDSLIKHEARTSAGSPRKASPTPSMGKRSSESLSPLGSASKMICLKNTPQSSAKQNRKITEFTAIIPPKEDIPPKICDSIRDVLKDLSPETETYTTVRGKVTQVGKLSKRDKYWELKATIDDDTASLDVMFSSQVLEGLIGFTVSEFLEKKKMRKTSPEVEDYLREGFRKAESAIKQMDVLMELELSTNNGLPKVVNTTGLTNEQRELIEKRIKIIAAA